MEEIKEGKKKGRKEERKKGRKEGRKLRSNVHHYFNKNTNEIK